MVLTTQLQYCTANFLQQIPKHKNSQKTGRTRRKHAEVRYYDFMTWNKLYLPPLPFFLKHIKRDPKPTIIWLHKHMISTGYNWFYYPKYCEDSKARRQMSFYKMRNWGTEGLNYLSAITWKLLTPGLMPSSSELPSPSITTKYPTAAGQAAAEPTSLRHRCRLSHSDSQVSSKGS